MKSPSKSKRTFIRKDIGVVRPTRQVTTTAVVISERHFEYAMKASLDGALHSTMISPDLGGGHASGGGGH
jgi:hypothetical protein